MPNQPTLSVVIPTHQRAATLQKCLEHLAKQTITNQLEVIVVSDGHDSETVLLFDDATKWPMPVRFFEIEKSQQGVARNYGVQKAGAPIVLFIGDDIFLAPDACEKHLNAHKTLEAKSYKLEAILGFTTWDPDISITPAMTWLEKTGWQFGYSMLAPYQHGFVPKEMQERFTYTSNISVPTAIAKKYPFRTDVTLYGWEDILWGQELKKADVPLYYEPDATALHHHTVTLDDSLARIETLGQSLMHITKIAPELDRKPTGLKLMAYKLIAFLPTLRGRHYRAFLAGIRAGEAKAEKM